MRMTQRHTIGQFANCMATLVLAVCPIIAHAQNQDILLPAASATKAKSVLGQAIAALGGPAYLNLRNSACTARYAQFEKSGALGGFIQIRDYWEAPDKSRTEYDKKGNIVQVYAGDQGWTLDRGGVTEMDADSMADYQEQRRTALSTILRFRLNDDDLAFRYGGSDIEDLKQVDWVEIGDRDGHAIRVAIDKRTHLPVRFVVITREPSTGQRTERSTSFSNYNLLDGIQTPFQVSRYINGQHVYQVFYEKCQYNVDLTPAMFSRISLDAHYATHK